jgi:RNA polymerase sigma-70 factor (ECF subfamily)
MNVKSDMHSAEPHALLLRWEVMRSRVIARLLAMGFAEADAEDLFGQALLRGWDARAKLHTPEAAEAWFWRLVQRMAIDAGRAASRRRMVPVDEAIEAEAADPPALEGRTCACSLRLLAALPEGTRDLIRQVDLEGLPVRVAAETAGITANNASVRLHRGRRQLRDRLEAACGTTSVEACLDCGCPP